MEEINSELKSFLNTDILELKLNKEEATKRRLERDRLRKAIRSCCLGDSTAREIVRERIREELLKHFTVKGKKGLLGLFPFGDDDLLTARDMFEYLYFMYGLTSSEAFDTLCEAFSWTACAGEGGEGYLISEEDIRDAFCEAVVEVEPGIVEEVAVQRIYEELFGFGAADLLIMDTSLDGVSAGCGGSTDVVTSEKRGSRSCDTIFIMYKGKTVRLKFLSFESDLKLQQTVKKLCRNDARNTLSRRTPYLICSLKDNSRVVASRPPYSPSWTFFLRRFTSCEAGQLTGLITDEGSYRAIEILKMLTKSEQNFVISGNQGGGKTTLLKCLVGYIDPRYTLRVAENNFELNLNNLYPERNVHTLQERDNYSVYDSITAFKKMDSDVTILGEINEPKLAGAFVQLVQNGGRMAISTLHHNSTEKMIDYLRNALVSEFGITDVKTAEKQVVDSINFDVHMVRDKDGHHYIERITEIVPVSHAGAEESGSFECHDILLFDKSSRTYVVTDMISEYSRERIRQVLGGRSVIDFCAFLRKEAGRAA